MFDSEITFVGSGILTFSAPHLSLFFLSRLRVDSVVGYNLYVSVEEPKFKFDAGIDLEFFQLLLEPS